MAVTVPRRVHIPISFAAGQPATVARHAKHGRHRAVRAPHGAARLYLRGPGLLGRRDRPERGRTTDMRLECRDRAGRPGADAVKLARDFRPVTNATDTATAT